MKTSELTGAALDWAVAKCEGLELDLAPDGYYTYKPTTKWAHGGPIIEREGIAIRKSFGDERDEWTANIWANQTTVFESGSTPLVAAMRCFVASKLGDEVDVTSELLEV